MDQEEIRQQWVVAVLENRLATAFFLEADLEAPDLSGLIRPPTDKNERKHWSVSGEISLDNLCVEA